MTINDFVENNMSQEEVKTFLEAKGKKINDYTQAFLIEETVLRSRGDVKYTYAELGKQAKNKNYEFVANIKPVYHSLKARLSRNGLPEYTLTLIGTGLLPKEAYNKSKK